MNTEIYSDNCKVISHGSFLLKESDSNAKIIIDLRPEYKAKLNITFTFMPYRTGPEAIVKRKVIDNESIEFIIFNTEEPLGNGTVGTKPLLEFAGGKILTINYIFSRPTPNNPRMFTYAFYIEG